MIASARVASGPFSFSKKLAANVIIPLAIALFAATAWDTAAVAHSLTLVTTLNGAALSPLVEASDGSYFGIDEGVRSNRCASGCGEVFQVIPSNGNGQAPTVHVVFKFNGESTGSTPVGGLLYWKGALYGTTAAGGSDKCDCGFLFKLTPPADKSRTAWDITLLYLNVGQDDQQEINTALAVDRKGNFYAESHTADYDTGYVVRFKAPTPGQLAWTRETIYIFDNGNIDTGYYPSGGLVVDRSGNLFGTTEFGGTSFPAQCHQGGDADGCGLVFELSPPLKGTKVWTETVLHDFAATQDGANPRTGVTFDKDGNLLGTTEFGTVDGQCGCGTAFSLAPPSAGKKTAWVETVLYSFAQSSMSDALFPATGLLAGPQGTQFGVTYSGGKLNKGAVFKLTPPNQGQTAWTENVLASFSEPPNFGTLGPARQLYATSEADLFAYLP